MQKLRVYILPFILVISFSSCGSDVWEKSEITHKVELLRSNSSEGDFEISVVSLTIHNTDKRGTAQKIPDFMGISVDLVVKNKTSSDKPFIFRRGSRIDHSNFLGVFEYSGEVIQIHFINESFDENTFQISSGDSMEVSIETELFSFIDLFGKKRDYTDNMIKVLNSFQILYSDDINLTSNEELSQVELEEFKRVKMDENVKVFTLN